MRGVKKILGTLCFSANPNFEYFDQEHSIYKKENEKKLGPPFENSRNNLLTVISQLRRELTGKPPLPSSG